MLKFVLLIALIAVLFYVGKRTFGANSDMTAAEAAKLLDIPADASADEIAAAHKRLIAKVHPDAGGTAELATRINLARDTLLRKLPR